MAVRQLKDGRWTCYYREKEGERKGKLRVEYFGRGPKGKAAAVQRHEELGLRTRRPARKRTGITFGQLAKGYLEAKDFSYNSGSMLAIRLTANILPAIGHRAAIRITHRDLEAYVRKRRRTVKDSTIRRELTDIKAILNWAASTEPRLIPFNPVHTFRAPREDNAVILPPTEKETKAILENASPHLARAVLLSYYLGLRPGAVELLSLTWDAVLWDREAILVMSAHKGGPEKRMVPIHQDLLPTLRDWYNQDNHKGPIVHYRGKPVKSIRNAWLGALKRAGITRRIRPYDLRHNFVTQALESGADIKALSEIVGSRPETLMRTYQHVSTDLHRKTVAKIAPLGYTYNQNPKK